VPCQCKSIAYRQHQHLAEQCNTHGKYVKRVAEEVDCRALVEDAEEFCVRTSLDCHRGRDIDTSGCAGFGRGRICFARGCVRDYGAKRCASLEGDGHGGVNTKIDVCTGAKNFEAEDNLLTELVGFLRVGQTGETDLWDDMTCHASISGDICGGGHLKS
jgi:hypothetical protein